LCLRAFVSRLSRRELIAGGDELWTGGPSTREDQRLNLAVTSTDDILCNVKTIAITIEDDILDRIDRLLAGREYAGGNRSRVIREAVREYLSRIERSEEEEKEKEIFKRHRDRLARQAAALVKEQAKP